MSVILSRAVDRPRDEHGFTLVELLVVILMIGILAGIAIPEFLGQTIKAHDAAAKSQARTAETAAETLVTDTNGSYASISVSVLQAIEPTLADTSGAKLISAQPREDGKGYSVVSQSLDGSRFTITRTDEASVRRTCTASSASIVTGCVSGKW